MRLHHVSFIVAAVCVFAVSALAQPLPDDKPVTSPLSLLEVPADGVAYHDLLVRARALHAKEDWAGAEPLLEKLVREYQRDPHVWMMLADTKEELKKWGEAVEARRRAGPLIGWDLEFANGYMIAIYQLAAGDRAACLATLREMVFERHGYFRARMYDWDELAPLRNDPEFLELIGRPDTTGWSRERGWAFDIDLVRSEILRVNPVHRSEPLPREFERIYAELKGSISKLSDEEIFFGLNRMLATLRQGHVALWADDTARTPNRYLPLRFYVFPDGLYVIGADDAHQQFVGSRVVRIGTLSGEEALRRRAEAQSVDGDMQHVWTTPSSLAETYVLRGMGAINETARVPLTIERNGRTEEVQIATLAKSMPGRQDRLVAPPPTVKPPLFLSRMSDTFWTQSLPAQRALYVQVNNLKDDPKEKLADFGLRLNGIIKREAPRNLILDIRHNNGGTTQRYGELLRTLVAFSRDANHRVYVLQGRRTFSAAGNFVTDLERLVDPVFVGEASSECCNLFGDPTGVYLPYSRIRGELTAVRWQLSTPADRRREMSPEVPVQMTAQDFFGGRDPVMEAVVRMIGKR
jgi:hypothetical protein